MILSWSPSLVSGRSLCGILDQTTAIVGDRLFWSGGNYTFDDTSWSNTSSLYWLRLNDAIDVHAPIDMAVVGELPLPGKSNDALTGGLTPKSGGAAGTFFYDHTMLYAYTGMVGPETDGINNALWSFNTSNGEWSLVDVDGGRVSFGNNSEGVHASDARTGTSFYTGGWAMAFNGTNNGTVKFQSDNTGVPQWSFMTAQQGEQGEQGPDILKGAMVYVPLGQAGLLVAFGGYNTAHEGTQFSEGGGWDWYQRDFSEIHLYDVFSNTWYIQNATGDIAEKRGEFCAGLSAAPDGSSFQITMTGGWDQFYGRAFNDVYVLSLPSFRWIQISASNNPDTALEPSPGRNRHKCDMWKDA